jgi:hypothetical protein
MKKSAKSGETARKIGVNYTSTSKRRGDSMLFSRESRMQLIYRCKSTSVKICPLLAIISMLSINLTSGAPEQGQPTTSITQVETPPSTEPEPFVPTGLDDPG